MNMIEDTCQVIEKISIYYEHIVRMMSELPGSKLLRKLHLM